ncbi:hypothetical protein CR513_15057, partial [Mucuna pruriens]
MKMNSILFQERSTQCGNIKEDADERNSEKYTKEDKDKNQVLCNEYKKPGHFNLKKEKEKEKHNPFFKKKNGLMATWKDFDLSSLEEKVEEANLYLMADTTLEDEENENLKEEKTKDLSKVNTLEEVINLRQSLVKFVNGYENLKKVIKYKRHPYDKIGLGYDKKNDIKRDKSNIHCINYRKFRHLSYDCRDCPKGLPKPSRTNKKGPNKIWVPKDMIIPVVDFLDNRKKRPIMIYEQWFLTSHDGRKVYVPRPYVQVRRMGFIRRVKAQSIKHNEYDVSFNKGKCIVKNQNGSQIFSTNRQNNIYNIKLTDLANPSKWKQVRGSFEFKNIVSTSRPLELSHINMFGPTRTTSMS